MARFILDMTRPPGQRLVEVERQAPRSRVAIGRADNEAVWSPFDNRVYPSVASMRREARGHGLEEVGNERRAFEPDMPKAGEGIDDDLRRAAEKVDWTRAGKP